ncbi:chloride channel protein [Tropicimonas sp. IMCC34011]|uniref:chloride channel protein n=1 Tax=Tropicimonas sp. IMCC34011 TaxID=2248759 RepID=UPI000E22ECCA|nr:chloride channel protein [Tropicimonas sp. IMCC34011]
MIRGKRSPEAVVTGSKGNSVASARRRQAATGAVVHAWRVLLSRGPSQAQFWFIALALGIASGLGAVAFRAAISGAQALFYGTDDIRTLHSFARTLPWYVIFIIPVLGGLVVGLILSRMTPDGRVRSVADVIEGAALHKGRLEQRAGYASTLASLVTLSTGGSTGREGPVVHLAGQISAWVSRRINADGITGRDLLGCSVAAAVSASFNAPIAGAIFAMEVVLRHFAVHAFAPIVIASVAGTVVARLWFGDVTEFELTEQTALAFYVELPAFLMLGLVCGVVSVVLMKAVFFTTELGDRYTSRTRLAQTVRPMLSGAVLGAIAIWFPHIIGVGYETTSAALTGRIPLVEAIAMAAIKVVAVAVTMGGRMGGGMFSPSLMVGALTGLAFGAIATEVFPEVSGAATLYALAGMGAVAAAVLGAPISTTLIVFELTGDWQAGIAVMVSVSLAVAVSTRLVEHSFFLTQLAQRGVRLAAGPDYLLDLQSVGVVMRSIDSPRAAPEAACRALIEEGVTLSPSNNLTDAMEIFDEAGHAFVPVVAQSKEAGPPELLGAIFHLDAVRAHNRAIAERIREEHT